VLVEREGTGRVLGVDLERGELQTLVAERECGRREHGLGHPAPAPRAAHAETEIAALVRDGHADVAVGIEAAARAEGLAFVPLALERMDLIALRRDVFEPPLQTLFAWTRTPEFAAQAAALGGYDVANTGSVVYNA